MTPQLDALNDELRSRAETLCARPQAPELCAIELADDAGSPARVQVVREALEAGASPDQLGVTFVVVAAELAYEVDWGDHYSFWPRLDDLLGCRAWRFDHAHRLACTAAFARFADEYAGLRPSGQFALSCPHMSWPLFHAVLPRTAHRRMAKLLAAAAADPDLVVAADGCLDEQSLATLLRRFAAQGDHPAYFEGLLAHPTLMGRLGARLLRPERAAVAAADSPLIRRIFEDLQRDALADQVFKGARAEASTRAQEVLASLPAIPLSLGVTIEHSKASLRLEVGAVPAEARASRSLVAALEHPQVRVDAEVGTERVACGASSNLLFGPVSAPVRWPEGSNELCVTLSPQGTEDKDLKKYLGRSTFRAGLPLAFVDRLGAGVFDLANEVEPGARVAVLTHRAVAVGHEMLASTLGLHPVPVTGAAAVVALIGDLAPGPAEAVRRLATELRVRIAMRKPDLAPCLTPPLRAGSGWAEWPDGVCAFLLLPGTTEGADYSAQFVAADATRALETCRTAAGLVVVIPAALGAGRASVREGAAAPINFEVRRRAPQTFRDAVQRLRVALVPPHATIGHLLADACGCDLTALPGVHPRISLRVDDEVVAADLDSAVMSPLATADVLGQLWRRLGGAAAARPARVQISVEDSAAPASAVTFTLREASGDLSFNELNEVASVHATGEVPVVSLERSALSAAHMRDSGTPLSPSQPILRSAPGLYIARAADGQEAALFWATDGDESAAEMSPADGEGGAGPAREAAAYLRLIERAAVGPRRHAGAAMLVRERATFAVRRQLVHALCGARWAAAAASWEAVRTTRTVLAEQAAPLIWTRRTWLHEELPLIAGEAKDLVEATRTMCEQGVGDALGRTDADRARHIALLMTRASLAAPEADEECIRWAAENPVRGRIIHLLALALRAPGDHERASA